MPWTTANVSQGQLSTGVAAKVPITLRNEKGKCNLSVCDRRRTQSSRDCLSWSYVTKRGFRSSYANISKMDILIPEHIALTGMFSSQI